MAKHQEYASTPPWQRLPPPPPPYHPHPHHHLWFENINWISGSAAIAWFEQSCVAIWSPGTKLYYIQISIEFRSWWDKIIAEMNLWSVVNSWLMVMIKLFNLTNYTNNKSLIDDVFTITRSQDWNGTNIHIEYKCEQERSLKRRNTLGGLEISIRRK